MMKISKKHLISSLVLILVLVAAMALMLVSCDNTDSKYESEITSTPQNEEESNVGESTVGEGSTQFEFVVSFADGTSKKYTVKTDKTVVGDALADAGLIAGKDGAYGLYVKTVDGVTLDYNTDGKYWAFYVDGQYAVSGVDITKIEQDRVYSFKAE